MNIGFDPAGVAINYLKVVTTNKADHGPLHWIYDAVLFKSESRTVTSGLIGIPMLKVTLQTL